MRTVLSVRFALLVGLAILVGACGEEHRAKPTGEGTALILLDLQRDYLLPHGRLPVAQDQTHPLITGVNEMIKAARNQAVPVIYPNNEFSPFDFVGNVERGGAAERFGPGQAPDPRIDVSAGVYFTKNRPSAFSNPEFSNHLEAIDCGHLVIAGVYADHSVLETAKDAMARGYKVTVISDAVAGASDQDRDAALQQLKQAGAEVQTSAEFIASLGAAAEKQANADSSAISG